MAGIGAAFLCILFGGCVGAAVPWMEIFFVGFFDWVQKSYIIGEAYPRSQRLNYCHLLTFNWLLLQFRVRSQIRFVKDPARA